MYDVPSVYDALSYLRYFHWRSVLDVLLVAWLFYQCSSWVQGSRALLAAIGLAVIGGVALLARWSGLILAGWLFQSLWAGLWLILIIVFQPELRQILERLSLLYLVRGRRHTPQGETLTEVSDTAFDLARDKIGALIVLPQHDPLEPYLRGGIQVDAILSRELLRALFQPPTPTHDGAVVLRAQRIEQAACFLPMTTSGGLPPTYGARHRAALGLTERCDALCILVSEERGTVSLARQGALLAFSNPLRLRQELAQALAGPLDTMTRPGWSWRWLRYRLGAKLLALAGALGLWMAVAGQQSTEMALTIPIEYQHIATTRELRGEIPAEVTVRLRGSQLALAALRASSVRLRVSLERVRNGPNYIPLTPHHLDLPPGVELTDMRPAFLAIEVRSKENAPPTE
ncbi:MAG: diadenylate cyclase CdaA [Candidatus Tectimicrobiota bacterium]